jgi:hypothetical protein
MLGPMRMPGPRRGRLLWHSRFWDYPRDGALEWDGRRFWFDEAEPGTGVFNIMELTQAQWAVQDAVHRDFQAFVGTHHDYNEPGNRTPIQVSAELHNARLRPREEWHTFYRRWQGVEQPQGNVVAQWKYDSAPWPCPDGGGLRTLARLPPLPRSARHSAGLGRHRDVSGRP